jgi:cell wall-associated NlpC family hydrolase
MIGMIRDLQTLPQDALQYCPPGELGDPLFSPDDQQALLARLRRVFFAPWTAPAVDRAEAMRERFAKFASGEFFDFDMKFASGEYFNSKLRPVAGGLVRGLESQAHLETYPNCQRPAVAVANTSLRELPTHQPFYTNPDTPGGGPPFDQLQVTTLWPGTPLALLHMADEWAHVASPLGDGWMPAADLATVDAAFIANWMQTPLAGITSAVTVSPNYGMGSEKKARGTPTAPTSKLTAMSACRSAPLDLSRGQIPGRAGNETVLEIGAILPGSVQSEKSIDLLIPVSESGKGAIARAAVPRSQACLLPLPMTVRNLSLIANQMLGQPYGWGGLGGYRDCSSTTHDLFVPFGLWLPRDSVDQAKAGNAISLRGLSSADKERTILEKGKPWLTLLRSPGHIMLYIGRRDGRAAMLHNFWGVKTTSSEQRAANVNERATSNRLVVARCCITTLTPGAELPNLLWGGTYLDMMESMVILP